MIGRPGARLWALAGKMLRICLPPTVTLFAATGGGDADIAFTSHANFKYILENQQAKASACATIASIGGSFPLLRVAVLSKMGCGYLTAHVEDFPAVVLAEAAAELQSQLGAYTILKESARAAAGRGGALAADALGALFDAEAASAILAGDVTVDLTPEEVVRCCPWLCSSGSGSTTPGYPPSPPLSPWRRLWTYAPAGHSRLIGAWARSSAPITTLSRRGRNLMSTGSSKASCRPSPPPRRITTPSDAPSSI